MDVHCGDIEGARLAREAPDDCPEKEIKNRQQHEVKKAREQILAKVQNLDVSAKELLDNTAKKYEADKTEKVRPQYKTSRQLPNLVRTGRQPRWIVDGLANGKKLGDFRIK